MFTVIIIKILTKKKIQNNLYELMTRIKCFNEINVFSKVRKSTQKY